MAEATSPGAKKENGKKTKEKTREKPTEKTRKKSGAKIREKVLGALREHPGLSVAQLGAILGLTTKSSEWHIDRLRNDGTVVRVGPDKGGHWEIVK